jgi:hypothetical protein
MTFAFSNKLVAVMNEKVGPGVIMNALAHSCLAFGAEIGSELIHLADYVDADGGHHISSKMPFIILKANSNKIRDLRAAALKEAIQCIDFIHTMTGDTYKEQMERTSQTKEAELIYYGIVLFGDWARVSELTRKFSLWK